MPRIRDYTEWQIKKDNIIFLAKVKCPVEGKKVLKPCSIPPDSTKPVKFVKVKRKNKPRGTFYHIPIPETCRAALSKKEQRKFTFYKV